MTVEMREHTVTKKEAALRQITAAIEHYNRGEYECAITLAAAAEGQLTAEDGDDHLFKQLKEQVPPEFENAKEWMNWLNAARDWLKHETPQLGNEWAISDISAGTMILRAITKFNWVYREATQRMITFRNEWLGVLRQEDET